VRRLDDHVDRLGALPAAVALDLAVDVREDPNGLVVRASGISNSPPWHSPRTNLSALS
jgi:hypothetical protein